MVKVYNHILRKRLFCRNGVSFWNPKLSNPIIFVVPLTVRKKCPYLEFSRIATNADTFYAV